MTFRADQYSVTSEELPGDAGVYLSFKIVCRPRRQVAHPQGAADHDVSWSIQFSLFLPLMIIANALGRTSSHKRCLRDRRIANPCRFPLPQDSQAIREVRLGTTRTMGRKSSAIVRRRWTTAVQESTTRPGRWRHTVVNLRLCTVNLARTRRQQLCSRTQPDR